MTKVTADAAFTALTGRSPGGTHAGRIPLPEPPMRATVRPALLATAIAALTVTLAACQTPPETPRMTANAPTASVDLERFMGTWYVVANVPYFFENGKVATRDVYRLRPDGRIDNDFVFKKAFGEPDRTWNGVSTVVEGSGGREWKVQFIWPFSTRMQVLDVAPDYSTALLATPDRKLAWIFSREPVVDEATLAGLATRMAAQGVDRAALRRVPQVAGQTVAPIAP
jgi:apolipoprotein D and lipocalin family protein